MALRGNLKDFSLPDVFQLVTFSRKTGVLRIAREDGATGSVWFREGDVFFASSNWHADPLGERLVKAQRVTPQALKRALEVRKGEGEGGRRLGQILIDEGYITEKVLESFVQEQIQDTIFDLMRWDEGDFDFEAMPDVVEEDIGLTVSIENVVMEGSRRLEEWGRIKKKIPSMDVVFKMATAPGEGTFEISLKPMEWQLLLLIDGTRSVAELASETNRTDFEVARIVYGLFSAGLLEFATDEEVERNRAERAEREVKLAEIQAKRREAEEAAKRESLAREQALAEEARKRQESEEAAAQARQAEETAAVQAKADAEDAARAAIEAGPVEEPEFLGGPAAAPSADDQAVLDEFMGAVLSKPAPKPEPEPEPEPEPVVPAEPYVPAEEPAFMSATHDDEADLLIPVPSVEDLLGIAPVQEPVPVAVPEPAIPEPEPLEPEPAPVPTEVAAESFVEPPAEVEAPVESAEPDFERDLLSLGLGELPSDLLQPMGEEPATPEQPESVPVPEAVTESPSVPVLEFEEPEIPVAEPMSEAAAFGWEALAAEIEPAGPEAEPEPEIAAAAPEPAVDAFGVADGFDELAALAADLELPVDVPAPTEVAAEPEIEMDFSDLIQSLDVDAEVAAPGAVEPVAEDFDVELLRDDTPVQTGGVISTDAFLEDIQIEDMSFSGGMTDELSALTGAERRQPSRPQASVNAIPDDAAGVLHRDTRVDKDTLLKIIDGIKNL